MKFKVVVVSLMTVLIGIIFGSSSSVEATAQKQNSDFEVQPILPKEQKDQSLNYFDLSLSKDQTKEIKMKIQNFTNHKITVNSDLRNAMTQIGGGINFQPTTKGLDQSLKNPFTKIAKLDKNGQRIDLDPRQAKTIKVTIKMPSEQTRGLIYGDWHFIEYLNKKGGQTSVASNYAYSVGVALRGQHYRVYPELKYHKVSAMLYQQHPATAVKIRNTQPMAVNNVSAKAVVSKKGVFSSKRVFTMSNKSIAPNSILVLPVSWNYDRLDPGKYTVEAAIKGENLWNKLPMTWHFKKQFTIRDSDVKSINAQSIKKPTNMWAYVATASGIIMLISTACLIRIFKLR